MEDKTLRETLEESIEKVEGEEVETEEVDEVETKAEEETTEETETEVSGEEVEQQEPAVEAKPATQPPVDWANEVKEKWADLPPDVQTSIVNREAHINETLRETADIRKEHSAFSEMIAPYIPVMQAEGAADPQQAIQGLLNTTATLTMGSPQQKAQKIAAMINHYGIDIQTLDQLLAGQAPPENTPPSDPRIDAIWNRMQQSEQATVQQAQQEASKNIQQFAADPKNVHFQTVKEAMADFIDVASSHGHAMTLDEAYQRACLADPQIAPLVTAQYANSASVDTTANDAAASSISGKTASSGHNAIKEDMSLRETIEAQFVGNSGRI